MLCCAHGAIIIYPEGTYTRPPHIMMATRRLMWSSSIIFSVDRGVMRTSGSDGVRGDGVEYSRLRVEQLQVKPSGERRRTVYNTLA